MNLSLNQMISLGNALEPMSAEIQSAAQVASEIEADPAVKAAIVTAEKYLKDPKFQAAIQTFEKVAAIFDQVIQQGG